MKRIDTNDRHECEKISGKVWHLLLNRWGNPACGYCQREVKWTQVADHLQFHKERFIKKRN